MPVVVEEDLRHGDRHQLVLMTVLDAKARDLFHPKALARAHQKGRPLLPIVKMKQGITILTQ